GPGAEAGQDMIEPGTGGGGRRTGVGRGDRGHDNLLLEVLVAGWRVSPPGFAPSDDATATGLTPALPTFFRSLAVDRADQRGLVAVARRIACRRRSGRGRAAGGPPPRASPGAGRPRRRGRRVHRGHDP